MNKIFQLIWKAKALKKKSLGTLLYFFWDILFIMVWKSSISQLISNLCAIDLSAREKTSNKKHFIKISFKLQVPKNKPTQVH